MSILEIYIWGGVASFIFFAIFILPMGISLQLYLKKYLNFVNNLERIGLSFRSEKFTLLSLNDSIGYIKDIEEYAEYKKAVWQNFPPILDKYFVLRKLINSLLFSWLHLMLQIGHFFMLRKENKYGVDGPFFSESIYIFNSTCCSDPIKLYKEANGRERGLLRNQINEYNPYDAYDGADDGEIKLLWNKALNELTSEKYIKTDSIVKYTALLFRTPPWILGEYTLRNNKSQERFITIAISIKDKLEENKELFSDFSLLFFVIHDAMIFNVVESYLKEISNSIFTSEEWLSNYNKYLFYQLAFDFSENDYARNIVTAGNSGSIVMNPIIEILKGATTIAQENKLYTSTNEKNIVDIKVPKCEDEFESVEKYILKWKLVMNESVSIDTVTKYLKEKYGSSFCKSADGYNLEDIRISLESDW